MLPWSWSLGRVLGIDTRVHATFVIVPLWAAYSALADGGGALAAALAVLFVLGVFASVLLHELGHALTARLFGVPTRRIVLSPLGGVAQLEGGLLRPREELYVALAGPLVSFILAGAAFTLAALAGPWSPAAFFTNLAWANLMLAAFNMLPAFPMDGGRVLRALLAARLGLGRGTAIAARVGRIAALLLIAAGLLWTPTLALIGAFVFVAAGAEARAVDRFLGRRPAAPGWLRRPARPRKVVVVIDEGWN